MDIGVVLQCDPPALRLVDLAVRAETLGFSHVWTFDSHLLWQEPFVIHSAILGATRKVVVGPMVTNPANRDWTVIASSFATLNDLYGNRSICGIGRGDSAVRTLNGKPSTLATLREAIEVIRELANSRSAEYGGQRVRFPWSQGSELDVWVAAYGPKALELTGQVADGYILQLGDPDIAAWTIGKVRAAAEAAGRDPASIKFCVAAPAYVTRDDSPESMAQARDQCRWFGGMVGNHVADLVRRYGTDGQVPAALTDYIVGRAGYDYNEHGRVGNSHTTYVPDEIVDRFCILGTPSDHLDKLAVLAEIGVDQFAVYLQHNDKRQTLESYGENIIPALMPTVSAIEDIA